MARFADDYIEVHERVQHFYEKYPEGSIQSTVLRYPDADYPFVHVASHAYRTADDRTPAVGNSAEPYPGTTNFTRNSEMENAETSAIGRALAALGFDTKKSMASANEIRGTSERSGVQTPPPPAQSVSPGSDPESPDLFKDAECDCTISPTGRTIHKAGCPFK